MKNTAKVAANQLIRLTGNLLKMQSDPSHWIFTKLCFTIPVNATVPRAIWQATLEQMVYNVKNYEPSMWVYHSTGPTVLNNILSAKAVINAQECKYVCIQGSFANEHLQYIDKPRDKCTHINPEEFVKK